MPSVRDYLFILIAGAVPLAACSKKVAEPAPVPSASAVTTPTFEPPPPPAPSASVVAAPVVAAPIAKPEAGQIKACCAAIHAGETKAPAKDQPAYRTAGGVCDGIAKLVAEGKTKEASAMTSVHAAARGITLPGACK